MNITDIRKGVRVRVTNNPAIADTVYRIREAFVTERALWLDLVSEDSTEKTVISREEKAVDCEVVPDDSAGKE